MMDTRFRCVSKTIKENGAELAFEVVTADSEEHKKFFKWTPYGKINVGLVKTETADAFVPGKVYSVVFSEEEG